MSDSDHPGKLITLITESGWYRLGDQGWERVADDLVEAIEAAGGGYNLVRVDVGDPVAEEPLF